MPWKSKHLPGEVYGKWTLIERNLSKMRPIYFICRCQCGLEKSIAVVNLVRGYSTQCMDCAAISRSKDEIGKKYNFLTIISIEKVNGKSKALVSCECGNQAHLPITQIKSGQRKSCGKCLLGCKRYSSTKQRGTLKIGNKKGLLTIIKSIDDKTAIAKCDCGTEMEVKSHHLKTMMPSCGCYWKQKRIENAKKYIGLKWGYLTIKKFIGMLGRDGETRAHYELKCKCGNIIQKEIGHMFDVFSCGCFQKESVLKGQNNPQSKIKDIEVLAIRELFSSGLYTRHEIAKMMNLQYHHVCQLIKGKNTWTHL